MAALSVVFGVVTAVGIIRLVNARPLNLRGKEAWAQVVSGLAAAGVLLISVPFTLASTRASPDPVAFACGMGALVFIAHGARTHVRQQLYAGVGLYGLVAAEHPGVLWAAPAVLVALLVEAARWSDPAGQKVALGELRLDVKRWAFHMARFGGCFVVGWISWPLYAWVYRGTSASGWLRYTDLGSVLLAMARAYRNEWQLTFPTFGGLLLGVLAIGPALYFCLPVAPRGAGRWKHLVLDLACVLSAAVLTLLDVIAPRPASMMLPARVWPSVAAAFTLGRFVHRWWGATQDVQLCWFDPSAGSGHS